MPEIVERADERLTLWRRSIALFERIQGEEGLFHQAGYDRYVLEPRLGTDPDEEKRFTPDLLGASGDRFVICELSVGDHKELDDLERYRDPELTPFLRAELGLPRDPEAGAEPFYHTLEAEDGLDLPAPFSALLLGSWQIEKVGQVHDAALRSALQSWEGFSVMIPTYSVRAVPESPEEEVKRKMGALLYKYGAAKETVGAPEVTRDLLGDLHENLPRKARSRLEATVRRLLPQAAKKLDKYAEWSDSDESVTFMHVDSASARKAFRRRVDTWMKTEIPPLEAYGDIGDASFEIPDDLPSGVLDPGYEGQDDDA